MGSSPRMRGTRHHARLETVETGIIPAYAGNTRERHGTVSDRRDHPRVCGEHLPASSGSCTRRGSSPRMRGTPYRQPVLAHGAGIIPAYAGNTRLQRYQHERCRDHPRVCGEHCEGLFVASGDVGSSPRMRGTPARYCASRSNAGIIPAYAGNTSTTRARRCLPRDHPRVCGEHQSGAPIQFVGLGIIPAYAGNTRGMELIGDAFRDHPRVCGEHFGEPFNTVNATGSSPRMRGTHHRDVVERWDFGIIPAYAGNTFSSLISMIFTWDHPRVCGEHICSGSYVITVPGSSPRMRGTRTQTRTGASYPGIIPAYAGNTIG